MVNDARPFDPARHKLADEIVFLLDLWKQYLYLFGDNDRIQVLNGCAPWFFRTMQRVMYREIILGISRLTDPINQSQYINLVLASMAEDPALQGDAQTKSELTALIKKVEQKAQPLRQHRMKYIAHLDEATALGTAGTKLPELETARISDIIESMQAAYNFHGSKLLDSEMQFGMNPRGSAEAIVQILASSSAWAEHQAKEKRLAELRLIADREAAEIDDLAEK